jgi:cytidine deaminase
MDFTELKNAAQKVVCPTVLTKHAEAGSVGAALLTASGNVYTGVCIDTACSMGFCAEHAAAAAMVTNQDSEILKIVSVNADGAILAPCGRCREFLTQLHPNNHQAHVLLPQETTMTLAELLPYDWK